MLRGELGVSVSLKACASQKSKVETGRGGGGGADSPGTLASGTLRTLDSRGRQNGGRVGVDDGAPSPDVHEQGLPR